MSVSGTVFSTQDLGSLRTRLARLQSDSEGQWGRMNAHQAVCHQADALEMALGRRSATPRKPSMPRPLLRFLALRLPMAWPHGVPTVREADQEKGGTQPTDFEADVARLEALLTEFAELPPDASFVPHPAMGTLTHANWGRWAYRHSDHHLRQFGV